jgi:hypothetical protein
MVARISIQFATKSSIVTIASLPRFLAAKHIGMMDAVEVVSSSPCGNGAVGFLFANRLPCAPWSFMQTAHDQTAQDIARAARILMTEHGNAAES